MWRDAPGLKEAIANRAFYPEATVWTDSNLFLTGAGLPNGNSEIFALTGTIQYDLWKNVLSRREVRWDHLAGDGDMVGYGSGTANKRNNVLIAANVIYQF